MKPLTHKQARERYNAMLPERLQRLNKELAIDRTKHKDTLNAVRVLDGVKYSFPIEVFWQGEWRASTKVNGRVSMYAANTPADAYLKLTNSLGYAVSQMHFQANEAAYQARKAA